MIIVRRIGRSAWMAVLLFSLASCDSLLKPEPLSTPAELEQKLFGLVNAERNKTGAPALAWHDAIAEEARGHSRNMAAGSLPFGHDGFSERFSRITGIIPARAGGENIAYSRDAESVCGIWMESAPHKINILGDYDFTGVGVAWSSKESMDYFTQIFILSR